MKWTPLPAMVLVALFASGSPVATQTRLPPNFSALMTQQLEADLKKLQVGLQLEKTIKQNRDRQIEKWDKLRQNGAISPQAYEQRVDYVQKNYQKNSNR